MANSAIKHSLGRIEAARFALALTWQASKTFFLGSFVIMVLTGLLPAVTISLNASLLAALAKAVEPGFLVSRAFVEHIGYIVLGFWGVALVMQLLGRVGDAIQSLYQKEAGHYIQTLVAQKAAELDLANFEDPSFYDVLQSASSEASSRPMQLVQQISQIASSLTTLFALLSILAVWHIWLPAVALICPYIFFRVSSFLALESATAQLSRTELQRKYQYTRGLFISEGTAKEFRVFQLRRFLLDRLNRYWALLYNEDKKLILTRYKTRSISSLVLCLERPLFVAYAIWQLLIKAITFRSFNVYIQAIGTIQAQLRMLAGSFVQLEESRLYLGRLHDLLSRVPVTERCREETPGSVLNRPPSIEFREVSFRYLGAQTDALMDVSFRIDAGQVIAVAGANGAGKSTLIKLITGLYSVTKGSIFINDCEADLWGRSELRTQIAVIFQDFNLYHWNVAENIAMDEIASGKFDPELELAIEESGLKRILDALPAGRDTIMGRYFKGGHELSGGQRQLVALARVLKKGSSIVILDEPTSALDRRNEAQFMNIFFGERRSKEAIVLFCSHREAILERADKVLYLEGGRVAGFASHTELNCSTPAYRAFVTSHLVKDGFHKHV